MMERGLNDYQVRAADTSGSADGAARWMVDNAEPDTVQRTLRIDYSVLGLTSEAGEVANKWKKILRDHQGRLTDQQRTELMKEMGGVLWYLADMATQLGVRLSDVANVNIQQLRDRKQRNALHGDGDNR